MKYLPVILVFIALSQPIKAQQMVTDTSFMQHYCASNYNQIDGFFDKGKMPSRTTANKNTIVYALPDLQAKQTDKLEAFTSISYLKEGNHPKTKENWIKINYKQIDKSGNYREKEGYSQSKYQPWNC